MDVPLNVDVECGGTIAGRSTYIVLNPVTDRVTHLVVQAKAFPHRERLVPVEWVVESDPRRIRLRCTLDELTRQADFIETEFIPGWPEPRLLMWPDELTLGTGGMIVEHEQIPGDELALERGARVKARDGDVGRVDELVIDPMTDRITHLVLREGHLWRHKEVAVPVAQIDRIEEDTVYLKLDRHAVRSLFATQQQNNRQKKWSGDPDRIARIWQKGRDGRSP
jgi:uncharacterized protein YrrD